MKQIENILVFTAIFLLDQSKSQAPRKYIELYEEINFQGLLLQRTVSPNFACMGVPNYWQISSLKTNVCLMVYASGQCSVQSNMASFLLPQGKYSNLAEISHRSQNAANPKSFRECKDDEGDIDGSIHIELYKNANEIFLAEYYDLSGCVNLPKSAYNSVYMVNNHGNCVTLYNSTDCLGDFVTLKPGVSKESLNLNEIDFGGRAQSVGLCKKIK